uniref:Large ribosomal subunit protein uL11c n=1 Tax=Dictyopteris divaricata TaxID=156996 RepID=A0A2I4Q2L2_9PHAE|nr:50S ribosomal protein L11 [Dictyopteris divaricata]YP_010205369.1 50S ribosomal protein L11 [Grateloupia livida]AQZ25080.1 50S ribosomal protein L11 [Dictyopteris divaricata]UAV85938.1 50S ribosomal protein L11 [Grateloupia livida]
MGKKVTTIIKLALSAGKAVPAPPVGPALSQHGVNISAFCKEYNGRTADQTGLIIPVEISVYEDRSYTFVLKTPPASFLLIKALNKTKGASEPNKQSIGAITEADLRKIAETKLPDLNTKNITSAIKIIEGTAKNMGINITKEK